MWWRDPILPPPPLPALRGAPANWGVACPRCGAGEQRGRAEGEGINLECVRCLHAWDVPAGVYPPHDGPRGQAPAAWAHALPAAWWVLVPIEATPAMVAAAGPGLAHVDVAALWRRMVRAGECGAEGEGGK